MRGGLVLIAIAVVGCTTSASFAAACEAMPRGATITQIDGRLAPFGGRRQVLAHGVVWMRETWVAADVCQATFDGRDRLIEAHYYDAD